MFGTSGREVQGTQRTRLGNAPVVRRHSAATPDSALVSDTDYKKLKTDLADALSERNDAVDIAKELVRKNNNDNDAMREREYRLKALLSEANKNTSMLLSLVEPTPLVAFLQPVTVPESSVRFVRLDEGTYVTDKMATRRALAAHSADLGSRLEAVADEDKA